MNKMYDTINQSPAVDVTNEEWYKNADATFNAHMADYYASGQPGSYSQYVMETRKYKSNLDPLETMGYLNAQRAIDSKWDYFKSMGKAVYNGCIGVVRDTLNGIRTARDYNMVILRERSKAEGFEYNPDLSFINALDSAVKVQALQPFEIKQSASTIGQFGLDLAQGAGQLVGQMGGALAANAVLPGVGGIGLMVGQITGGQYEDLKARGVDTKRAAEAAFANAMIQAPFEYLSLTRLMKRIPAGSVLKKKLKMVAEDMATEGITEFIQQFPEEWAELWALNPDKSWKELREMAAKKFPDTLQSALYAGIIGAVLGAGSRGIHLALDRNIDLALRKEVHDENIQAVKGRMNKIKETGISPDYAAETINANLNNATVYVDGGVLQAYCQRSGGEKTAEKLGVSMETVNDAAEKGDTVEINQGNFEAVAASDPSFFEEVKDDLSFDSKDISNRKYDTIQKNIERYSKLEEEQRKELKTEVDKIAATMEQAGVKKGVIAGWKSFFTAFAMQARPDDPAQFLRDYALRFERGTALTRSGLNFTNNVENINLVTDILSTNYDDSRAEVESRLKTVEEEISKIGEERPAENAQEWIGLNRQRDLLKTLLNGNSVVGVPSIDDYKKYYNRETGTFDFPKPGQYRQAMTNLTINLDEEVVPINLDEKIPYLGGLSKSALEAYIREIASHWKPVPIGELNKLVRFSDSTDKYGQRHVIYSNPMRRNKINVEVLGELLSNYDTFKEVIKNARLVEVTPNTKKEEITNKMGRSSRKHAVHKGKVNQYYRFFLPVIHNNQGYTLVLTCEEHNGELQLSKDEALHLYEMSTVVINNKRSTDPERSSATRAHPSGIPAPKYNIRQMLKNVKGIDGKPYIDKNGMPNWGETVQQLEGPFDSESGNVYKQMAGQKALNANKEKLNRAIAMHNEGKSNEEIFKETGWLRGSDNQWRFEIPDDLMKIDVSKIRMPESRTVGEATKLGDIYGNEKLYEAYPWLRDINVVVGYPESSLRTADREGGMADTWGYADYDAGMIFINAEHLTKDQTAPEGKLKIRQNLVHEVQHLIQDHENFARGGSPRTVIKAIENEIDELTAKARRIHPDAFAYYNRATEQDRAFLLGSEDERKEAQRRMDEFNRNTSMTAEQKKKAWEICARINNLEKRLEKNRDNPRQLYKVLPANRKRNMRVTVRQN